MVQGEKSTHTGYSYKITTRMHRRHLYRRGVVRRTLLLNKNTLS